MVFLLSFFALIASLFALKKTDKKKEITTSFISSLMLCIAFMVLFAGILTIIHIKANIYTIGICNIIIAGVIAIYIFKTKEYQKYYLDIQNICSYGILTFLSIFVWYKRFSSAFNIVFETSDPGPHLKMIMDFVNSAKVSGLYFPQVEYGLFVEALCDDINGIYKVFEIIYGINFFLSSAVFFAGACIIAKNSTQKLMALFFSIIYMFGYPYNDMLFGFCYLQIAITYIGLLVIFIHDYLYECENDRLYRLFLAVICSGVGVAYTLFVPVLFLAMVAIISNVAVNKKTSLVSWIIECLEIFVLPTIIIFWAVFMSVDSNFVGGLSIEGYIYRNLYSDFFFFIIPTVGFYIYKNKDFHNLLEYMLPLHIIYSAVFWFRMLKGEVSTYYFYKLNYLGWFIFCSLAFAGICLLFEQAKGIAISLISIPVLFYGIFISDAEHIINSENINYLPYVEADSFFHIFEYNKVLDDKKTSISTQFVDICKIVNEGDEEQKVIYIGDWLYTYWYEALTNQRFSTEIHLSDYEKKYDDYIQGAYGRYAVIEKLDDVTILDTFIGEIIFENDFAYIVDLGDSKRTCKKGMKRYHYPM